MNKSQNTHNDLGAEEIVTNKFGLDPKIPSKSSLIGPRYIINSKR